MCHGKSSQATQHTDKVYEPSPWRSNPNESLPVIIRKTAMSMQPPKVHLSGPVLAALQERAEQEKKSADELANELVMTGLHREDDRTIRLMALMEYGHRRAEEPHPRP